MGIKKVTPETAIKQQIKDYLNVKGIFWWWNLQGIGCYKGLPDIMAVKEGKLYAIEVKTAKGELSEHQENFLQNITGSGCTAIVARCVEDVIKCL